jgi:secondary thiamine-phosphate synthase enzyme
VTAHTAYLTLQTDERRAFVRITDEVAEAVRESGLDKLAPPSWREPSNDVARELLPNPGDYRHHRGGEDNGDAHLKNLLVHHQVIVPVTDGRLDLGPWQAIFYTEFDGRRPKRLVIKVLGE